MIITEEEAKKRWCPMVRVADNGAYNRGGKDDTINELGMEKGYGCNCIASECMIWQRDRDSYRSGYCGLGGKP